MPKAAQSYAKSRAALRFRAQYCPDNSWVFCNAEGERIKSVKKGFALAAARAGLKDLHPHDLRRTCGSWLVQSGQSIHSVATLLRHSDIRITDEHYAHLAPDNLREVVDSLGGDASRLRHGKILDVATK